MDSNFSQSHTQTSVPVIALRNVVMEKDSNLNAMMAITKVAMDVQLNVKLNKDGVVKEDQVLQQVSVCQEIQTELIYN
jgi:hypothetical protein